MIKGHLHKLLKPLLCKYVDIRQELNLSKEFQSLWQVIQHLEEREANPNYNSGANNAFEFQKLKEQNNTEMDFEDSLLSVDADAS